MNKWRIVKYKKQALSTAAEEHLSTSPPVYGSEIMAMLENSLSTE